MHFWRSRRNWPSCFNDGLRGETGFRKQTRRGVAHGWSLRPPTHRARSRSMNGAQFHTPRVGNAGGRLKRINAQETVLPSLVSKPICAAGCDFGVGVTRAKVFNFLGRNCLSGKACVSIILETLMWQSCYRLPVDQALNRGSRRMRIRPAGCLITDLYF
jgi:hypothetical protein